MRYYSDILKEFFDTVSACEAAEEAYYSELMDRDDAAAEINEAIRYASEKIAAYNQKYGEMPKLNLHVKLSNDEFDWTASVVHKYVNKAKAEIEPAVELKTEGAKEDTKDDSTSSDFRKALAELLAFFP